MAHPDPTELLKLLMNRAQTVEIVGRTRAKAQRGAELRPWGMRVKRHLVDAGSSLAADDADFMTDYATDMVSGTAVFPIMNAIDSITSIAELIDGRDDFGDKKGSGDHHAGSILTLSRMATESSARTIWLLSDANREMRRGLSARFTASELNAQRGYHALTRKYFEVGRGKELPAEHAKFLEHVRLFDERVKMLEDGMKETPKAKVVGNGDLVSAAARWLDKHPPRHEPNGPFGDEFGFQEVATSFYSVSSAIVHGLKWPLDYIPNGEVDLSRMIVEGVNNAVAMAECAVALFEAQAQNWDDDTDRPRPYPAHLQSTIEVWAGMYPTQTT